MKDRVFLDSSAIFAIADKDDDFHQTALNAYTKSRHVLTHSVIFLEAFSLISKRIAKHVALDVLDKFRRSPRIETVFVDEFLQNAGWQRCLEFSDKEWDWIDCISFELMERNGVRSALTLDRHFRQAGFNILC